MFCTKCGIRLTDDKQKCCQACSHVVEKNRSSKKFSLFKFFSLMVLCFLPIVIFVELKKENDLQFVVEEQLKALKNNHITEAYYHFSSKEFQKNVSLEKFHDWYEKHPILSKYNRTQFAPQNIEGTEGEITGLLIGEKNDLNSIEVKFVKEGKGWKISELVVEDDKKTEKSVVNEEVRPLDNTDPIQKIIFNQLDKIKKNDLKAAFKYFSGSLDPSMFKDFKEYTDQFPILKTFKSISVLKTSITDEEQDFLLLLSNKSAEAELVYALIKEDNAWKVADFQFIYNFTDFRTQVKDINDFLLLLDDAFKNIRNNELEKVYKQNVSDKFRDEITYDDLVEYFKTYPIFMDNRGYAINTIENEVNQISVKVQLVDPNNNIELAEFLLGREDNKWKIWKFTVYLPEVEPSEDESDGMLVEKESLGAPSKRYLTEK